MARRRAMLLTTSRSPTEMEELVFALGVELVHTVYQRRAQPDPQTYLGSGKLEEARATQRAMGVDLVVVDAALKPGQIFGIQRFFRERSAGGGEGESGRRETPGEGGRVDVYDRTRLILEIFKERARSQEARLQVELATLQYEMPLVKEAIHLEKRGERQAAMFGGGQYGVDDYLDMMKRRMARIRRDLEKVRLERGVRRKHRRRGGFHLVSLAGYTNAGKSSLLRRMTASDTLVENRYFSTLSTKTARAHVERRDVLVTDTVGFIEDLPPWMIDAFHSTLEEVAEADVILLVVDASDPLSEIDRRVRSSLRVLHQFDQPTRVPAAGRPATGTRSARSGGPRSAGGGRGSGGVRGASDARGSGAPGPGGPGRVLVAMNKADRVPREEMAAKVEALVAEGLVDATRVLPVSAATGEGVGELYERIVELIPDYVLLAVSMAPAPEAEALLAWLYANAAVLEVERGERVRALVEVSPAQRAALQERLEAAGPELAAEVEERAPDPAAALALWTGAPAATQGIDEGAANGPVS